MTAPSIETRLRDRATALGFSLFGVAPATDADGFGRFCAWLDKGYAGGMDYLHEYREERRHPRSVVADVRSVVMLGLEYGSANDPTPRPPPRPGGGGRGVGSRESCQVRPRPGLPPLHLGPGERTVGVADG